MFLLLPPGNMRNWRFELNSDDAEMVQRFRKAARRVLCCRFRGDTYSDKYQSLSAFHQSDHPNFQQFEFWCGEEKVSLMQEAAQDILKEMGMPADFLGGK